MEFVVVPNLVLYMDFNSSYTAGLRAPYRRKCIYGYRKFKII